MVLDTNYHYFELSIKHNNINVTVPYMLVESDEIVLW